MQFVQCAKDALLKPLQTVGGIIEGRQTLPILANVLIEKTGSQVWFTTTDLDIQIKTKAEIGIGEENVKTTLPASKLTAILSALPQSDAPLNLALDGKKVLLRSGASRFSLSPLNAEEYPDIVLKPVEVSFTLPASKLKYLLQMVHFAMAQQDIRYYLNGVLLVVEKTQIRTVATDGHRLACCDEQCDVAVEQPLQAILPRKTVLQLMKLLPDVDDPVQIEIGNSQARFTFGDIEFVTKLIDGKFPDYNRVIPAGNNKVFLINREELMGALRRAAILANEKFKGLRWLVGNGHLQIQSANSEMEEALEEIAIEYSDEELDLGFNVTYLLDVLGNLKNTDVKFAFSSSQGATLLTMPESDKFRYVLMPMRI